MILMTLALVGTAGVAFAFWTGTGAGSGSGTTGNVQALVLTQTSTVTGLAPGSGTQVLSGTFANPNDAPVYVANVTAAVTGTDKTGCTAADYTISGPAVVGVQVDDGDTWGEAGDLTIAFNNSATLNQDVCKDAVVTIAYTANGS